MCIITVSENLLQKAIQHHSKGSYRLKKYCTKTNCVTMVEEATQLEVMLYGGVKPVAKFFNKLVHAFLEV